MTIQSAAEHNAGFWPRLRAWLATPVASRLILALILLTSAYLRLSHVNWDLETHLHPDERFLTMVEDKLKLPQSLGEYFDSSASPLNPYNVKDANGNMQYPLFVYGDLPMTLVTIGARVANRFNQATHLWTSEGSLPIDLTAYWGVHYVGRTMSGLADLGGVLLLYVIGRRLYGRRAGLVAAALLAFAPLPLQQSHFFTSDTFATFFSLVTFYFAVRVAFGGRVAREGAGPRSAPAGRPLREGGWLSYIGLGVALGATVACRINLAPEAGIALLAIGIRLWDEWRRGAALQPREGEDEHSWLTMFAQAALFRLVLFGLATAVAFRVLMPYAFAGNSILNLSFAPHWLDNMHEIQQLIGLNIDYPPGEQWTGRTAFVFPFVNMVVWGLGLPLGLAGWTGWLVGFWQIARSLTRRLYLPLARRHLLPVAWVGGMFLWQGLQAVQSMRYLLPIYPLLCLLAAWLLWWLVDVLAPGGEAAPAVAGLLGRVAAWQQRAQNGRFRLPQRGAYVLLALVTIGTMLWGWGFLAIYRRPFTRVTASRWMYANIPAGSHIANEHWDDPLPVSIDGKCAYAPCGPFKSLSSSGDGVMDLYGEDTPEKRDLMYRWLDEADYIVMSSNRLYGSIPRLPLRYPMTTLYYQLLFAGKLGFRQVAVFTSFPTILGIQFPDTGAEEAFSVYDHPVVYVFQKTPDYSEARLRQYFGPIDLENTVQYWPKQASKAPTALLMTALEAARQRAGGTWTAIFHDGDLVNRAPALLWLILIEALGLIAFPFMFVILRRLDDRGYAFAKTAGMLALAWLSWVGPALKLLPFSRGFIALALLLLAAGAAVLAWRQRADLAAFWRTQRGLLLAEEALFLALFVLFLLIRWGNPDLWHPARGGEKPMDFAYLNAVIKSTTFPPYDPWFAGGFINYYYFGFVIVGAVIKLLGIVPAVAYNLAVPTLFALTGLGAFGVAYNLAAGDGEPVSGHGPWGDPGRGGGARLPYFAGFAATVFVALAGNLGEIKLIFDQWAAHSTVPSQGAIRGLAGLLRLLNGAAAWLTGSGVGRSALQIPNDWWFWNASRVIPDTINEFPFFTFVYADLHAHMIAFPLALLGLGAAVALVRNAGGLTGPAGMAARQLDGDALLAEPGPWSISRDQLLPMLLLGFVIGALRATNTWDFPTYVLVALAALVVLEIGRRTPAWRSAVAAGWQAGPRGGISEISGSARRLLPAGAGWGNDPAAGPRVVSDAGEAAWWAGRAAAAQQAVRAEANEPGAGAPVADGPLPARAAETTASDPAGGDLAVPGNGDREGQAAVLALAQDAALAPRQAALAFVFRAVVAVAWRLLIVIAVASIAFYPFTRSYATAYTGLQPWTDVKTAVGDYLVVHGFFLVLLAIYLASEFAVQLRHGLIPDWLDDGMPFVLAAFAVLLGAGWLLHANSWLVAVPLFSLALFLACGRDLPPARRLALLLLALGLAITMGVEVVRLQDDIGRMNTVFKFYLQAWILFGVGTAFGVASWWQRRDGWTPGWRRLATAVAVALFACVMLYPPLAARAKIADRFSAEDRPHGLDGMAYMDQAHYYDGNPDVLGAAKQLPDMNIAADKAAIQWLLHNVPGSPVILEGNTPNYRWGGRFSIYTGLPSVMGWDWHEKQQRSIVPPIVVDRRLNQVRELYTSPDLTRTRYLLDYYHVSLIVVSALERAYYGSAPQAKFDDLVQAGYLYLNYDKDGVRIYRVVGRS